MPQQPSRALIVRSFQKDTIYIHKLQGALNKICQLIIGNGNSNGNCQRVMRYYLTSMESVAQLLYYLSSTASALQTLGEEYTSLIAVQAATNGKLRVPARSTLIAYSLSQSISVIFGRLVVSLVLYWFRLYRHASTERVQQLRMILQSLLTLTAALNTGMFYLTGNGYRLAQRLMGVSYVSTTSKASDHYSTVLFQLIGAVNVLRSVYEICVTLGLLIGSTSGPHSQARQSPNDPNTEPPSTRSRCCLCFESPCVDATAAPCGHVFCWDCIVGSTRALPECPLCRTKCHPSRLIYLHNL